MDPGFRGDTISNIYVILRIQAKVAHSHSTSSGLFPYRTVEMGKDYKGLGALDHPLHVIHPCSDLINSGSHRRCSDAAFLISTTQQNSMKLAYMPTVTLFNHPTLGPTVPNTRLYVQYTRPFGLGSVRT